MLRVCPNFVELGRRPFRLAVYGQAGKDEALKRPSPSWRPMFPNSYQGEKGASSALRNLSHAVYGLAYRAPTTLGHTPMLLSLGKEQDIGV